MHQLLNEFGCSEEIERLLSSRLFTIKNEPTAVLAQYLELDIEPLRRKERFEDRWDERVLQLCVRVGKHKEKFVVTDMSVKHRIQPVHLFSSPDEQAAVKWIIDMVYRYQRMLA